LYKQSSRSKKMVCCFFVAPLDVVVVVAAAAVILVDRRPAMNVFECRAAARNDMKCEEVELGKFSKNTREKISGFTISRARTNTNTRFYARRRKYGRDDDAKRRQERRVSRSFGV
jgi:hypothetical protein